MRSTDNTAKQENQPPVWNGTKEQAQELCNYDAEDNKYLAYDAKCSSQTLRCDFIEVNWYQDHSLE